MIIKPGVSHLDHGLSEAVISHVRGRYLNHCGSGEVWIDVIQLPPGLGTVPCALQGPLTGLHPIHELEVTYKIRGDRKWASRTVSPLLYPVKQSKYLTIIGGPDDDGEEILYTAHGGPHAPREPGDPAIESWSELVNSRSFWAVHALTVG